MHYLLTSQPGAYLTQVDVSAGLSEFFWTDTLDKAGVFTPEEARTAINTLPLITKVPVTPTSYYILNQQGEYMKSVGSSNAICNAPSITAAELFSPSRRTSILNSHPTMISIPTMKPLVQPIHFTHKGQPTTKPSKPIPRLHPNEMMLAVEKLLKEHDYHLDDLVFSSLIPSNPAFSIKHTLRSPS